ncbi:recombinase family protein (plasmid) [Erwinia pyri]|uniref:Recombinase family protein n=1 Tax=Erwinia pyri TaxID=3062598 RepID=A0AA50HPG4_9GAMM|nr:recombinase family protein [Erwinia sp. DE2]WLS81261.1 recombinase family protein [Erwinia sp. DE2]
MRDVLIYCRASTAEQHADRALESLREFSKERGWRVQREFIENASGAVLERPELDALLNVARTGDVLLVESIDRLSRLTGDEWERLKAAIQGKGLSIVAADLPTSWQLLNSPTSDLTSGILRAVNSMMIDILATMARIDYETRRARQAQGIERAKAEGKFKGKQRDTDLREKVQGYLQKGTYSADEIAKIVGCGRATVFRIKKELSAGLNTP